MSPLVEPARWQPLGTGRIAPAGSVADTALLGRLQAYKREVAGAYRSLPPGEILALLPPGPCVASEKLDGETTLLRQRGARSGGADHRLPPSRRCSSGGSETHAEAGRPWRGVDPRWPRSPVELKERVGHLD